MTPPAGAWPGPMPTMRIELEVADRAEAQRIVHAYGNGRPVLLKFDVEVYPEV